MSDHHVVIGAGPVGTGLAQLLAARGSRVTVVTRRGSGPDLPGVERVAADASDPEALTAAASGADVLHNTANPSDYTRWSELWPPLAESILQAAERTGALLATASCLYPYGRVTAPMVEGQPDSATDVKGRIRADMWAEALRRHEAGRIRAVEVRASDYAGSYVGEQGHLTRNVVAAVEGRAVRVLGSPDQPHSWTDVLDVARALEAVAGAEHAWGRVWHAPTNAPRTQREALTDVLAAGGHRPVKVRAYPRRTMHVVGLVTPSVRELVAMDHQFLAPYVLDSSAITRELGLAPTPWAEVCERTLRQ